jgi:hypothetical protein
MQVVEQLKAFEFSSMNACNHNPSTRKFRPPEALWLTGVDLARIEVLRLPYVQDKDRGAMIERYYLNLTIRKSTK